MKFVTHVVIGGSLLALAASAAPAGAQNTTIGISV